MLVCFLKAIFSIFLVIWKQFFKLGDKSWFQHGLWKHMVRKLKKKLLTLFLTCRNSKYPIRYFLWCHKTLPGAIWLQACWDYPFKHQGWNVFAQTVNTFKSLIGCMENSVFDVWRGSQYASAAKQGR